MTSKVLFQCNEKTYKLYVYDRTIKLHAVLTTYSYVIYIDIVIAFYLLTSKNPIITLTATSAQRLM